MILKKALYGQPILRKKAEPVKEINNEIKQLVEDMFETMRDSNGIGLAAPQVFKPIALFITSVPIYKYDDDGHRNDEGEDDEPIPGVDRVFINPKILSYSEETCCLSEGCLSIPGVYGYVTRPITITVEATDLDGKKFTQEFKNYEARCIMHENDHINGKLFIDRMDPKERTEIEQDLRAIKKKSK